MSKKLYPPKATPAQARAAARCPPSSKIKRASQLQINRNPPKEKEKEKEREKERESSLHFKRTRMTLDCLPGRCPPRPWTGPPRTDSRGLGRSCTISKSEMHRRHRRYSCLPSRCYRSHSVDRIAISEPAVAALLLIRAKRDQSPARIHRKLLSCSRLRP